MWTRYLLLIVVFLSIDSIAQTPPEVVDSIKMKLTKSTEPKERVAILGQLSRLYMNINLVTADSFGKKMLEEAEMSRKRKLIVEALLVNGERNSYMSARKENLEKSIGFYQQALAVAKQNKMDEEIARSLLSLSYVYRAIPDGEKAFTYCNQAFSYISTLNNDSMEVLGHLEFGSVYQLKREKLLALRNFLSGLRIAEELNDPELLKPCYDALSKFYASIEDYEKAIDYSVQALQILEESKEKGASFNRVIELNSIGQLYSRKKSYDVATTYFEKSINLADSLKYEPLKVPGYMGILNNFLIGSKSREALSYFDSKADVRAYITRMGMGPSVDQAYGYIYTDLGKYDSARYYYDKSASFFENNSNEASRYAYFSQVGRLHKLSGDNKKAIEYFTRAKDVAEKIGDPERIMGIAQELDTLYLKTGDFRQSQHFSSLYYQYKDSLETLGREKDLLQTEATHEEQKQKRLEKEREERKRKRYSIQYMGITIGIAFLFVLLVMMGMFKVSVTTIKAIGFFVFIMLFEFVFLIFKKRISGITHGEPWKDLLFMIGLAALLLPLHHWMEHRVIKYLTSHNRLTAAGHHLKNKLFRRPKPGEQ